MKDVIIDFIDGLKFRGVRVSVSETMDALRGVTEIGVADKSAFKSVLRATLVKDRKDIAAFDELFDLFFNPSSILLTQKTETDKKIAAILQEAKDLFSEEFMGVMQGDPKMMMAAGRGDRRGDQPQGYPLPHAVGLFLHQDVRYAGGHGAGAGAF